MAIDIKTLLEKKEVLKEKLGEKTLSLQIKSLKELFGDGEIIIKSLGMDKVQDILDMAKGNTYKASVIVVYNGVITPNLKDKELQQAFDCKTNPHGIVEAIFDPSEIKVISDKISLLSGIGKNENEVIEEIKK